MDFYTVKLKIIDEIANACPSLLMPRDSHVKGNWLLQTSEKNFENFPLVTVKMAGDLIPMWSRRTPHYRYAEIYSYKFTLFIFADSMTETRAIADMIIDHFQMHNKYRYYNIIDIINFTSKESIFSVSSRRYMRTIVEFNVLTEEPLVPTTVMTNTGEL